MTAKSLRVAIVGAGAAGITAAIGLARRGHEVVVIEGALHPGAENWSGSVYFCENLARPEILGEELLAQTPIERRVTQRGVLFSDGRIALGASVKSPSAFEHCYTVLRPVFDHDLALKARMFGAEILSGTQALALLRHGDRVSGVLTDRGAIHADVVFLAEGDASNLVAREGLERKAPDADGHVRPDFLQGIKEVLELPKHVIEERFGIGPDEGACFEILLRNGHWKGREVPLNAGTFLYTNRESLSIGIVAPIHNLDQYPGGHNQLMEWLKTSGPLAPLLEGAVTKSFGTKIIRGGGFKEMPRWTLHGLAVGGAAAGFGVDFPCPNYTGPASYTGFAFSEAVHEIAEAGGSFDEDALEAHYCKRLRESHYYADSQHLEEWPAFVSENREFFGRQVDLVGGTAEILTSAKRHPIGRHLDVARWLWRNVPPKAAPKFIGEMVRAETALGFRRGAWKEILPCFGWAILNLVRGWWPRKDASGAELVPHFWDDGKAARRTAPYSIRWLRWRLGSGVAAALHQLYANDGRRLSLRVRLVQRAIITRLSLLDLLLLPILVTGNVLVGATLEGLSALRRKLGRQTHEQRAAEPLEAIARETHALGDYSRVREVTSHDQKLSLINYANDERTHIHFHAAYDAKGLPTFGKSPLFSVCPAKVYQAEVDQTRNTAVAVLHENCVRCETCWRADDRHVDWGRTRGQKLVYEVYTSGDAWVHESREAASLARLDRSLEDVDETGGQAPRLSLEPRVMAEAGPALDELQEHRRAFLKLSRELGSLLLGADQQLLEDLGRTCLESARRLARALRSQPSLQPLGSSLEEWAALAERHLNTRRFFHFEADLLVLEAVQFETLRVETGLEPTLRAPEQAADEQARHALRTELETRLDRDLLMAEEEALEPSAESRKVLLELAQRVLKDGFSRDLALEEIARLSPALGLRLAAQLRARPALNALLGGDALITEAAAPHLHAIVEGGLTITDAGICDSGPITALLGGVDRILWITAHGEALLFDAKATGVEAEILGGVGLRGAGPGRVRLTGATPLARAELPPGDADVASWDLLAVVRGMGRYLAERALDHAAGRVQFPGMFRDLRGRDGVAKFGAVQDMLAGIATGIEILDEAGRREGSADAALAVGLDLLGPGPRSIAYLSGQVLGGTAYSEEDPVSRFFRDATAMTRLPVELSSLWSRIGHEQLEGLGADGSTTPDRSLATDGDTTHTLAPLIARPLDRLAMAWNEASRAVFELDARTREALRRDLGRATVHVLGARLLADRLGRRLADEGIDPVVRTALELQVDRAERRLKRLARRVPDTAELVALGKQVLEPGTTEGALAADGLDYETFRKSEGSYVSGELLVRTADAEEIVFTPELQGADPELSAYEAEIRSELVQRFRKPRFEGRPYTRHVEHLHHIPLEDVRYLLDRGFFRLISPKAHGGLEELKAKYYILCSQMMRQSDPTQAIVVMGSTSIGTTPILIGLKEDLPAARKALAKLLDDPAQVTAMISELEAIASACEYAHPESMAARIGQVGKTFKGAFERSKAVRLVYQDVASAMGKLKKALKTNDPALAGKSASKAAQLLGDWERRARDESESLAAREAAHAFYIQLIASGRISAFGLTEPSAGSDTARIRTRAVRTDVALEADPRGWFTFTSPRDGTTRTLFPYERFSFEDGRQFFTPEGGERVPVHVRDFSHEAVDGPVRQRFVEIDGARIAIDDMGRPVAVGERWIYPHFRVDGAKMWITNASVSGVMVLYARTDRGLTAFMLDSHAEGLTIGRDEHKMGQRGSATNELSLDGVRVPIDQIIGIEGRGQENALETLNVGRAGLAAASTAVMQEIIQDLREGLQGQGASPEDHLELGRIALDLAGSESLTYQLLGRFDHPGTKTVRMESAMAKAETTEALHRVLTRAERILGPGHLLDDRELEKRRRDARVLTIYEGTNEIQRFLLLRDLMDGLDLERVTMEPAEGESAVMAGLRRSIDDIRETLVARLGKLRASHGSAAWQRVEWQPVMFPLVERFVDLGTITATFQRLTVAERLLDAERPDAERRLGWLRASLELRVADLARRTELAIHALDDALARLGQGSEARTQVLADRALERHAAAAHEASRELATQIERPLEVALFIDPVPALAPEPRVRDGRLRELRHQLSDQDRASLAQIAAWRRSGPVRVTALVIGTNATMDVAEEVLALGADHAFLLETGTEHLMASEVVEQATELLRAREAVTESTFDVVLGAADASGLLLPFARRLGVQPVVPAETIGVRAPTEGEATFTVSVDGSDDTLDVAGPVVIGISRRVDTTTFTWSIADWERARRERIPVIEYAPEQRPDLEVSGAVTTDDSDAGADEGPIDVSAAASRLADATGLAGGGSASTRFEGSIDEAALEDLLADTAALAIVEASGGEVPTSLPAAARAVRAARRGSGSATIVVLTASQLEDEAARDLAGAVLEPGGVRVGILENDALARMSWVGRAAFLERVLAAFDRPVFFGPELRYAALSAAEGLHLDRPELLVIDELDRIEGRNGHLKLSGPRAEAKLRLSLDAPYEGQPLLGVLRTDLETPLLAPAAIEGVQLTRVSSNLAIGGDPDALAALIREATEAEGVSLADAEFIITVGYGVGSQDGIEEVILPLQTALEEMGVPRVTVGATRKVTQDLGLLTDAHQIGQTGTTVNPKIMIAVGVSGAPQHLEYIGQRALIFAFNKDPEAPLLALNRSRPRPRVVPIVGDLFQEVPAFVEALRKVLQPSS